MRSLFLVLALANVLLALWVMRAGEPEPRRDHVALRADVPKLEALERAPGGSGSGPSEPGSGPASGAEPEPDRDRSGERGPEGEAAQQCLEIAPFATRAIALEAAQRYRRAGHDVRLGRTEERFKVGDWVYLPPLPTRDAARQRAAELREMGIQDVYAVANPEFRNAISLGVYSESESVERRLEQLSAYDLDVEVRSRYGTRERFRLVVQLDPDVSGDALEQAPEDGPSVSRKPCSALAGD